MELKNLQYRTPMVKVVDVTPHSMLCQSKDGEQFSLYWDSEGLDE